MSINPLWEEVTLQCASSKRKSMLSQCYSSPTVWIALETAVVDLLCVARSYSLPYRKDQEAYTGRWRGQLLWCFGKDPNSSVTDVTLSDRLNGNVLVMYVTLVPWRRERRRHVPSPQLLYHRWAAGSPARLLSESMINAVHLLPLILTLWSAAAGCNDHMPMSIGSFSYTRSGWVSLARSHFHRSSDETSPFPAFREQELHTK